MMTPDNTFTYGGAIIVGVIMGCGFGFKLNSVAAGLLIGMLAVAGWLTVSLLWARHTHS